MPITPLYQDDPGSWDLRAYPILQRYGWNRRASEPLIRASNDAEAIQEFIDSLYELAATTRTLYIKETERLVLWCIHAAGMSISDLKDTEFRKYRRFLHRPPSKWCNPRGSKLARRRSNGELNPEWRPFAGPLSDNSIAKAERCVSSFFSYLTDKRYCECNPMPKIQRAEPSRYRERHLPLASFNAALAALEAEISAAHELRERNRLERGRFILALYFYLGLRISELANHRMGDFYAEQDHGDKLWFLRVIGKGNKQRDIPVPDELLIELARFRTLLGCPTPMPMHQEKTPLVVALNHRGDFDRDKRIDAQRISQIVRAMFYTAAHWLRARQHTDDIEHATRLEHASSHWIRHTYGTTMVDAGMPLTDVRDNLGHSSVVTTEIYLHDDLRERHRRARGHKRG